MSSFWVSFLTGFPWKRPSSLLSNCRSYVIFLWRSEQGLVEVMTSAGRGSDGSGSASDLLAGCIESSVEASFDREAAGVREHDMSEQESLAALARMTDSLLQMESQTYAPVRPTPSSNCVPFL